MERIHNLQIQHKRIQNVLTLYALYGSRTFLNNFELNSPAKCSDGFSFSDGVRLYFPGEMKNCCRRKHHCLVFLITTENNIEMLCNKTNSSSNSSSSCQQICCNSWLVDSIGELLPEYRSRGALASFFTVRMRDSRSSSADSASGISSGRKWHK